jgi:hypothetical protein
MTHYSVQLWNILLYKQTGNEHGFRINAPVQPLKNEGNF